MPRPRRTRGCRPWTWPAQGPATEPAARPWPGRRRGTRFRPGWCACGERVVDGITDLVQVADRDGQAVGQGVAVQARVAAAVRIGVVGLQRQARGLEVLVGDAELLECGDDGGHGGRSALSGGLDGGPGDHDAEPDVGHVRADDDPAGPADADRVLGGSGRVSGEDGPRAECRAGHRCDQHAGGKAGGQPADARVREGEGDRGRGHRRLRRFGCRRPDGRRWPGDAAWRALVSSPRHGSAASRPRRRRDRPCLCPCRWTSPRRVAAWGWESPWRPGWARRRPRLRA